MDDLRDRVAAAIQGEAGLNFVQSLGHAVTRKGRETVILCPFHDDHKPSCTIVTHKSQVPFYKCHSCGAGGDLFDFVEGTCAVDGFRDVLKLMASMLGLTQDRVDPKQRKDIEQRQSQASEIVDVVMTPAEVRAAMLALKTVDCAEYAGRLGVLPEAMVMCGAVVTEDGLLVQPMRLPNGALTSLRFRAANGKRWSLSKKEGGRQVARTNAGLMAPDFVFEWIDQTQRTMVIEGETDLYAGVSMMIEGYGPEPELWPARWIGLPGVNACHDLLTPEIVTTNATFFVDNDEAGLYAAFDHWVRKKGEDGSFFADKSKPMQPGLIRKLAGRGIRVIAATTPEADEDLRDLRKAGWNWSRLHGHILRTGTTKPVRPVVGQR